MPTDPERALSETEGYWLDWAGDVASAGRLPRGDQRLADRAEGDDVRAHRRHRGGADDLAARSDRRRAQLGLPLLLAARRHADDPRDAEGGLATTRPASGASGCCGPSPGTPPTSRSCTAWAASGVWTSASWTGSPGYEASTPVRVGNAASEQLQLDAYGEILDALYQTRVHGAPAEDNIWSLTLKLLDWLEDGWRQQDSGIWEVRGPARHFTHSKVMAWVAFDRAVRSVDEFGPRGARRPVAGDPPGDPRRRAGATHGAIASRRSRSPTGPTNWTRASC